MLLGRNGKALPGQSFGVALSWPADAPFQATFSGRTGQPPARAGQVMIDRGSARRGHFAVGETIGIAGHAVPFTVSGITGYGSADSIGGGSMAIFSLDTAQRLFGKTGEFDRIVAKDAPGVSAAELRDRIGSVLPTGDEAVTAASASASAAQQINSQLGILAGADQSPQATVAVPAGQLLLYVVATAAAGVLASIAPARRATRLDMLHRDRGRMNQRRVADG